MIVAISSDPVSPIRPVGSDVTLTCTVVFSTAMNVEVDVSILWTGPDGFMTTKIAQPVMGSTTTYTSTAMVNSFGRGQSGVFTCTATASPNSSSVFVLRSGSRLGIVKVTTGMATILYTINILTPDVYGVHITHFPGVYISHNGVFIEHDSSILITDIGTSSPHELVCTTDKTPCLSLIHI